MRAAYSNCLEGSTTKNVWFEESTGILGVSEHSLRSNPGGLELHEHVYAAVDWCELNGVNDFTTMVGELQIWVVFAFAQEVIKNFVCMSASMHPRHLSTNQDVTRNTYLSDLNVNINSLADSAFFFIFM